MSRHRWFAALALLCVTAGVSADDPPAPKVDLVVTVERAAIPHEEAAAAVTLLRRQDIERLPATTLSGLLAFVPGVTMMFDSGTSGAPMITSRGFFGGGEVEYVKLLVDGVPVGDAESGNVDWRSFRASAIERLEVLHGPGSSLYGDAALGGVIQLYTRSSGSDDGELHVSGGSFGTAEVDAGYVADVGDYKVALRAGSSDTDGFRAHAGASSRTLQLSLTRAADRSRWRFDVSGARTDRREPGPLTRDEIAGDRAQSNPFFRFDRDESERRRLSATYESFRARELLATVYASDRETGNLRTLLLAPGFGVTALRDLSTRAAGTTLEASRDLALGSFRAGLDADRASLDGEYSSVGEDGASLGVTASRGGQRDRIGLFLTGAWNVCARCRFTAGIRRDELRDRFDDAPARNASAWSPRAGLNVRLGGTTAAPLSLFVQVSRAFKAPTLDQLFDPRPYPDGFGGTFTISNPELRPQRARNLEAGLSRLGTTSDWSLVAYRMNVTDEIDFDPQTFTYRNLGSSIHRGLEASVAFAKSARVSPRLTYAWTRVADSATPDRQLKNIPEHVAQLLLHTRLTRATSADVIYRWSDGLTLDDEATFSSPDVSRVDLRLTHELSRVRLYADVLNALDEEYNELGYVLLDFTGAPTAMEFPAPARSFRFGLTWKF